jgi:hypothetical protein
MNKKHLFAFSILLLFLLCAVESVPSEKASVAASSATVSLMPTFVTTTVAQEFGLNLSTFNVTDLYLWVATIQWDPSLLNLTGYSEGPFLKQGGSTTFIVGKMGPGKIEGLTCSLKGAVPGVGGNGTLATLQFNATTAVITSVCITFSDLLNSNGTSMTHYVTNDTVVVFQLAPLGGAGGRMPYMD